MARVVDVTLKLTDRMTSPLNRAGQALANHSRQFLKAGRQIESAGKSITRTGSVMTKGITLPVVAAGTACVRLAADFESGMSKVQSISGASAKDMDKLSKKAKEMGAKTKFSATEASEAFSYMAMAGWKTKDMLAGVGGIMTLAGATGEELASVSDIVTDSLTSFGMSAKQTGTFVDVLAATAGNSNTNVNMLGESFKYCAPVAGSLGYNVKDVSVALGLMANSGIKASSSGTALRSMMTNMAKPTKSSGEAMKALGISLTDSHGKMKPFSKLMVEMRGAFSKLTTEQKAQYAAALAGKTGMSGLLAVVNSSDKDFNKLTKAVNGSKNACQKMYDVAQDNLNGQLTILKSTLESIAISFGEKLTPYVKKFTTHLQNMADRFNSLTDQQQNFIIKAALIAASVGPAILVFGKLVTGVGKAVTVIGKVGRAVRSAGSVIGLLTSPAGIVIAVLAGIALAAVLVAKNWDRIKPVLMKVRIWFLEAFGGADGAIAKFKAAFGSIASTLSSVGNALIVGIGKILPPLINGIGKAVQKLIPVLKQAAFFMVNYLADAFTTFATVMQKVVPVVIRFAGEIVKAVLPAARQIGKSVMNLLPVLKDTFMKTFKAVMPAAQKLGSVLGKLAVVLAKTLGKAVKSAAPLLSKAVKIMKQMSSTAGGVLSKTLKKLGPVIQKLGNLFSVIFNKAADAVFSAYEKTAPYIGKAQKLVLKLFEFCVPLISSAMDTIGNTFSVAFTFIGHVVSGAIDIFGGIIDFITGVFTGNWSQAWNGVVSIFKGIINLIPAAFEGVINLVIGAINGITGGINKVTGAVGIPEIPAIPNVTLPRLARGTGNWSGGLVQISERGGEIVDLPQGSRVYPHDRSVAMAKNDGRREAQTSGGSTTIHITVEKLADSIVVREESDIDRIAQKLADKLEKTAQNMGGGKIEYSY